jgi:hypothetical protein
MKIDDELLKSLFIKTKPEEHLEEKAAQIEQAYIVEDVENQSMKQFQSNIASEMNAVDKEKIKLEKKDKEETRTETYNDIIIRVKELSTSYKKNFRYITDLVTNTPELTSIKGVIKRKNIGNLNEFLDNVLKFIIKSDKFTKNNLKIDTTDLWKLIYGFLNELLNTLFVVDNYFKNFRGVPKTNTNIYKLYDSVKEIIPEILKKFNFTVQTYGNIVGVPEIFVTENGSGSGIISLKNEKKVIDAFDYGKYKTKPELKQLTHFKMKTSNELIHILYKVKINVKKMDDMTKKIALKHVATILIILIQRQLMTEEKARDYYTKLFKRY